MKISQDKIDQLIEEATVDCYDDDEYAQGILTVVNDEIHCPFEAKVLGESVKVVNIKQVGNQIKTVCDKQGKKYDVDLMDIDVDSSTVKGGKWIEVYSYWKSTW